MDTEIIHTRSGDVITVVLDVPGSSGISVNPEINPIEIISVRNSGFRKKEISAPGDPVEAVFQILPHKKGTATIRFFYTQPWNPNFQNIPVKELILNIE